jgi:hypothetical protein
MVVDNGSALGFLHCAHVGNVTNVSQVHAASIFRVEVSMMGESNRPKLRLGTTSCPLPMDLFVQNLYMHEDSSTFPTSTLKTDAAHISKMSISQPTFT